MWIGWRLKDSDDCVYVYSFFLFVVMCAFNSTWNARDSLFLSFFLIRSFAYQLLFFCKKGHRIASSPLWVYFEQNDEFFPSTHFFYLFLFRILVLSDFLLLFINDSHPFFPALPCVPNKFKVHIVNLKQIILEQSSAAQQTLLLSASQSICIKKRSCICRSWDFFSPCYDQKKFFLSKRYGLLGFYGLAFDCVCVPQ